LLAGFRKKDGQGLWNFDRPAILSDKSGTISYASSVQNPAQHFGRMIFSLVIFLCSFSNLIAAGNEPVITVNGAIASSNTVQVVSQASVSMSTAFPQGQIFYTTNGAAPSFNDKRYTAPFTVITNTTLRAIAYSSALTESAEREPLFIQVLRTFTLTVDSPYADIRVTPFPGPYVEGTIVSVTLTQIRRPDAVFAEWRGTASGTNQTIQVTMDRNHSLRPFLKAIVAVTVLGNGRVEANPTSISPRQPDPSTIEKPTSLLTAIPDPGFRFVRWEVPDFNADPEKVPFTIETSPTASPALVSLSNIWPSRQVEPITAIFAPLDTNQYSLTVRTVGGDGFVRITPPQNVFTNGEIVQLTATNQNLWMAFADWSGATNSKSFTIDLPMDGSKNITANFVGTQSLSTENKIDPRDEDGNVYHNYIGRLVAKGPTENWTFGTYQPLATEGNHIPVTIASNIIYAPAFVQGPNQTGQPALFALTHSGTLLWIRTNIYSRVVLDSRERPYVSADNYSSRTNIYLAIDPQTGSTLWDEYGTSIIIGSEDRIYSFVTNRILIRDSNGLFTVPLSAPIGGPPVLHSSGDLFLSFPDSVVRITYFSETIWSSDRALSNLTLANDRILGEAGGRIYALDANTGELLWTTSPLPSLYGPFSWSLDHSGNITVGIYSSSIRGMIDYLLSIQTGSGLSTSSPWPWPGGDELNRSKTQWFAPPKLALTVEDSTFQLQVQGTPRSTSIYHSTNLQNWQFLTNLPPNGSVSLPADAEEEFFKAISE